MKVESYRRCDGCGQLLHPDEMPEHRGASGKECAARSERLGDGRWDVVLLELQERMLEKVFAAIGCDHLMCPHCAHHHVDYNEACWTWCGTYMCGDGGRAGPVWVNMGGLFA